MTLKLANRAICTPDGIASDVFVPVGKFTFPADFVVVDYESDPRVPLILGRPFLRTARALINVHGEEMILCDGDERLNLNMKHDTASYSNYPHRESANLINIFNIPSEDCLKDLVSNKQSGNPTFSLHKEIASLEVIHEIHDSKGCKTRGKIVPDKDYILLPLWTQDPPFSSSTKDSPDAGYKSSGVEEKKDTKDLGNKDSEALITEEPRVNQEKENVNITNRVNVVSSTVNAASNEVNAVGRKSSIKLPDDQNMPELEDISISQYINEDVFGAEADLNNLESTFQMDVKSAFLYGKIKEEVHVCQPLRFEDPDFPKKVYKVEKALYGLHQAPRACKHTMETHTTLLKDEKGEDVDEHLYRSMIGSLMYLTSLRHDIMFAAFWYPKDSPFDLVAYTVSDYAGASLDRKSTIGGCQFPGCRLISWQCKKQTVVA
nr:ribonuclease H-like domain, reverse transcriptase, RNA-dependent DNA polymerase [Tanacetum cinerariifolium]